MAKIEVKQVSLTRGKQLLSYPDLIIHAGEKILITGNSGRAASQDIITRLLKTDKTILFIAHNLSAEIRRLFYREIQLD